MARSRTAFSAAARRTDLFQRCLERKRSCAARRYGKIESLWQGVGRFHDCYVRIAGDLAAESVLLTISAAQGPGRVRSCQTEFGKCDRNCRPTCQFWDDGA